MSQVVNVEVGLSQRLRVSAHGVCVYLTGLLRSARMVCRRLPRLCRQLPALGRFYRALYVGERCELPVEGDGSCWAYGLRTTRQRIVAVFNRSVVPVRRRVVVTSLGLHDGLRLNELVHDARCVVAGGAVDIYLSSCGVRIFMAERLPVRSVPRGVVPLDERRS